MQVKNSGMEEVCAGKDAVIAAKEQEVAVLQRILSLETAALQRALSDVSYITYNII